MSTIPSKVVEQLRELLDWLPKHRYLELYDETDEAITKRMRSGVWKAGEQYSRPDGGGIWISVKGVNAWAAKHTPKSGPGKA